ncbi:MAG TPA: DUF4241 domain-containing protein [Thermomicrobiales bacterium]|nr:DUF4241 domain-containing protein [Thermomicrobiales bacterium]
MDYPDFTRAFEDGREFGEDERRATVHSHRVADLIVPSGYVVACDPLVVPEQAAFDTEVAPGRYPVILSVAQFRANGDRRVAYAMLRFNVRDPLRWVMATRPGQDVLSLPPGRVFCYGVDSGTGCFMDAAAARALRARLDGDAGFSQAIIAELEQTYTPTWDWANVELDPASGVNLVCFHSGFGDGCYASYFGLDAQGAPACLVTDFGVVTL